MATKTKLPSTKSVVGATPTALKVEKAIERGNLAEAKKLFGTIKDKITPGLAANLSKRITTLAKKK